MPKKDDTSVIPESVLKQQRAADAKMKAAAQDPAQDTDLVPEPSNADPIEPAADTPKVEPQHDGDRADPTPEPAIPNGIDDGAWEQKYKVLQGKYDKEVPRLRDEIAGLKVTLERQEKVLEQQSSQQNASSPAPDLTDLDPTKFDGWGEEMVDMVKTVNSQNKLIKDQAEIIKNLKGGEPAQSSIQDPELLSRVEMIEKESHASRVERYFGDLERGIKGDWKQINTSKGFNAWLNEEDAITMVPRRAVLEQAASELRSKQVASIFNEYIKTKPGSSGNIQIADDLPGSGGRGDDVTGGQKPKLTVADLKKAEADFIAGRITEDDYNKVSNAFQTQSAKA